MNFRSGEDDAVNISELIDEKIETYIKQTTTIVNAGGRGVRLLPYTRSVPKPLLPVGKDQKPLIYYAMLPSLLAGVSNFTLNVRYGAKQIIKELGHGLKFSREFGRKIHVDYVIEPKPLGRVGCIKYALENRKLNPSNPALIINASDILSLNLRSLIKHYIWLKANYGFEIVQVYVLGYKVQYGIGRLHPTTGQVLSFEEKPIRFEPTNTACYFLHRRLNDFKKIVKMPSNPEDELVEIWTNEGVLGSYVITNEDMISIKLEQDLLKANDMDLYSFVKRSYEDPFQ